MLQMENYFLDFYYIFTGHLASSDLILDVLMFELKLFRISV